MGAIWKTTLTFAVVILIVVTGVAMISANADVTAAEHYMVDTAMVIQESNYNDGVIDRCRQEADSLGYRLEVEPFAEVGGRNFRVYVHLYYRYQMPVFGFSVWKKKDMIL